MHIIFPMRINLRKGFCVPDVHLNVYFSLIIVIINCANNNEWYCSIVIQTLVMCAITRNFTQLASLD